MKIILQTVGYGSIAVVVFGLLLFWPAGTFDYWQAWVFLAIYAAAVGSSIYWGTRNPAVLQRRLHGGPAAETRVAQKLAITGLFTAFAALLIVSALDHRFGWSTLPAAVWVVGDVLVAVGLGVGILTVVENSYAAANITVEAEQRVISTGLYGFVRHPMYFSLVIVMVGIPLALGSYWGLAGLVVGLPFLALRIEDEENMLEHELAGYPEYAQKVRYRLVPFVW
ncbi:methyltransferase family protein [Mycobacterium sp.]|uniref:methyltransferase family protein n=1 Tax=Mycobacterium sp. TaxID=1785 RepID=UPI003D6B45A6